MKINLHSAVACVLFLQLASSATAQDAVYECTEEQPVGSGQCDEFTSTNDEHVDAGRATRSFFGTYRTVGTRESLGRNTGDVVTTLVEIGEDSYSLDPNNCPVTPVPNISFTVDLRPAGPVNIGQSGTVRIVSNPNGADLAVARIFDLAPNTTFTLVMAESDAPNALPHYLLAEFTTDADGDAVVVLATEIVNAYIGANPGQDADLDGIPDGPNAGAVANGAITISLDFFRVYAADGNANVFGVSPNDLSGAIVLTSDRIPDPS
ncbi:MAG: hypothetical protein OXU20_13315 [Myxococcales bacterium]|nr:hypothetical protein [Myxococcales bacterium]MDD9970846.1 hypothetical protein [Myxococcales bacterium]